MVFGLATIGQSGGYGGQQGGYTQPAGGQGGYGGQGGFATGGFPAYPQQGWYIPSFTLG